LSFDPNKEWNITASFGEAYRYPTVTELYQNITVGGVATFANPLLAPEQDFTGELNIQRKWNDGRVRLTLFKERTNNAIISQTNLVANPNTGAQTPTTTISNNGTIRTTLRPTSMLHLPSRKTVSAKAALPGLWHGCFVTREPPW